MPVRPWFINQGAKKLGTGIAAMGFREIPGPDLSYSQKIEKSFPLDINTSAGDFTLF